MAAAVVVVGVVVAGQGLGTYPTINRIEAPSGKPRPFGFSVGGLESLGCRVSEGLGFRVQSL